MKKPACKKGKKHDWKSPHEVVGGCSQNPGVWDDNGVMSFWRVCSRCGVYRLEKTRYPYGERYVHGYEPADEASRRYVAEMS